MAVLTGKSGGITFGDGYAVHCNSWTVEFSTDVFEDTALGDSWRTRVVGINEWSGSYDCALDETTATTIGDLAIGEAAASATFTYASGGTVGGNIVITGATLNTSISGVNTINFTFVGSGAPSFT
jgi:hypothetical protein